MSISKVTLTKLYAAIAECKTKYPNPKLGGRIFMKGLIIWSLGLLLLTLSCQSQQKTPTPEERAANLSSSWLKSAATNAEYAKSRQCGGRAEKFQFPAGFNSSTASVTSVQEVPFEFPGAAEDYSYYEVVFTDTSGVTAIVAFWEEEKYKKASSELGLEHEPINNDWCAFVVIE